MTTKRPPRTEDGRAWVSWTRGPGESAGWRAVGARSPTIRQMPFWRAIVEAVAATDGRCLDEAHAIGDGLLSIGALGLTAASGAAQQLLLCCLEAEPARFLEVMAPVIAATGMHLARTERSPSGVAFATGRRDLVLEEAALRELLVGGSDGRAWTPRQKVRARLWVECCSELLRDQRMDAAQATYTMRELPRLVERGLLDALKWPSRGLEDPWQYSREQQVVWAFAVASPLVGAEGALWEAVLGEVSVAALGTAIAAEPRHRALLTNLERALG